MAEYKAYLIVRDLKTRKEVGRVGVSSLNERRIERIMLGMLRNMDPDYFIDDSEVDKAREKDNG